MHFWLGTVGILIYMASMYVSGITQGLMLGATKEGGTVLAYPNFIEAVTSTKMLMHIRALGGLMYLVGFVMLAWNIWKTARGAEVVNGSTEVYVPEKTARMGLGGGFVNAPVIYTTLLIVFAAGWGVLPGTGSAFCIFGLITTAAIMSMSIEFSKAGWNDWYERLLANAVPFTALTTIAVFIGGLVQIIPTVMVNTGSSVEGMRQIPYTPLELAGRDIYIREGCYNCHSQQIRTLVGDVLRYGEYSKIGESIYDYPYQWGSKRIGPDLAREGGKYPHSWHYFHMRDPRQISPGSTMPVYPWLFTDKTDTAALPNKIAVQRKIGVPYPPMKEIEIQQSCETQAAAITAELRAAGAEVPPDREIVALIAYLQKLGKAEKVSPQTASNPQSAIPNPQ
jgi:cytochrome c oxidase cbb3-type subunit I/II